MRPGLVFLGLFAVLIAVYATLSEVLGAGPTFVLQAAIVVVILGAALWLRRRTNRLRPPEETDPGVLPNDEPAAEETPAKGEGT